jgi:hypothetical protein
MICAQESKLLEEYEILGNIRETQRTASVTRRWSHTHTFQKAVTLTVTAMIALHFSKEILKDKFHTCCNKHLS